MNILDIDLDFFLCNRALDDDIAEIGNRLNLNNYPVWPEDEVSAFLENSCGLTIGSSIPISIIRNHDEVFGHVIDKGMYDINLYHIDAHIDLYKTESPWFFNEYTRSYIDVKQRILYNVNPRTRKPYLNEGNYIGFLLACERLSSVHYITNKEERWGEMPCRMYCKDFNELGGILQIPVIKKNECSFDPLTIIYEKLDKFDFCGREVPFDIIDYKAFDAREISFDYAFLSQSPEYTPEKADELIPVIKKYFNDSNKLQ